MTSAPARRHLPERHTQPGDLQALVAQYGGYHLIPASAWAKHDAAVAQWRAEQLAGLGLRPLGPEEMKKRRRALRAAKKPARPPGAGHAVENASAPSEKEQTTMDMRNYSGSAYLKVDDLAGGERTETISEVVAGSYDRPVARFESGDALTLNITNTKILCSAWGRNSDAWHGKTVCLYIGETTFQGERKPSIFVRPVSPPIPVGQQKPPPPPPPREEFNDEIPFALAFFIAGAVAWLAAGGSTLIT